MSNDWDYIYRLYYKSLLIYAVSLTHDINMAEDLVSETFVKAILSYENIDINCSFKAWCCRVLKNLFIDTYRKRKFTVIDDQLINKIGYQEDIINNMFLEQRKKWIYQKIFELPLIQREIILLSINFELSDMEIAKQLNISEENVRVIRYRTKLKLMELAKKEGYYER